jgi:transposase InsO family protein
MLDAAIETVAGGNDRPVVHSDRGAHYRWPGWLARIGDAKLVRSMSRKGCSPDNAACEGFFGRLKTELFYPRDWTNTTIEQFIQVVDSYIRWYNEKRIKVSWLSQPHRIPRESWIYGINQSKYLSAPPRVRFQRSSTGSALKAPLAGAFSFPPPVSGAAVRPKKSPDKPGI